MLGFYRCHASREAASGRFGWYSSFVFVGGLLFVILGNYIFIVSEVLVLFFALLVGLALVVAVVRFVPEIGSYMAGYHGTDMFLEVLEEIFSLVVGIEFIKMLCKPNTDNVIEALVFLVARHMIIVTNSAIDNLFSIISIAILFLVKAFIHDQKRKHRAMDLEQEQAKKSE